MKKIILLTVILTLFAFISGTMAQQKSSPAPAKPTTSTTVAPATPAPAKPTTTTSPAPAAPAKEVAPKVEKFSGVIDKVDEMAKTLIVKAKVNKEEKTMSFVIDDKTKITKSGKDMPFAELKKEMNVSVEYNKKDGDKNIAVSVKVASPKAKK